MEQKSIRIVNKTKDSITLRAGGNNTSMSWEEFNRNFEMEEDKMHCHFKKEFIKKGELVQAKIADAAATYMMLNAPAVVLDPHKKLVYMGILGSEMEEIQKMLNCSIAEAAILVKKTVMSLQGFVSTPHKETKEEYENRHKEMEEARDPHRTYTPTATQKLGDLPGMEKLKEMIK